MASLEVSAAHCLSQWHPHPLTHLNSVSPLGPLSTLSSPSFPQPPSGPLPREPASTLPSRPAQVPSPPCHQHRVPPLLRTCASGSHLCSVSHWRREWRGFLLFVPRALPSTRAGTRSIGWWLGDISHMKGVVSCHRVRKDARGLICALQTMGEIEEEALARHSGDHGAVACARDQVLAL